MVDPELSPVLIPLEKPVVLVPVEDDPVSPEVLLLVLPVLSPLVVLLLVLPLVALVPGTDTTPVFEFPPKISAAKMLPFAFATMRSLTNAFATWNKISPVNLPAPPLPQVGQPIPKSQ